MNYYNITEKYLYNYRPLKASIENMSKEIDEIDYFVCNGFKLGYTGYVGYRGSITEVTAINIYERKDKTRLEIMELKNRLDRIDRGLNVLSEIERYIIDERYFEGREWWKIAYKLRYSERWCKELRRRSVNKIAISLFGEKAMEEDKSG